MRTKFNYKKIKLDLNKKGFSLVESFLSKKEVDNYLKIFSRIKKKNAKNKKFHNTAKLVLNLHLKNLSFYKIIFNKNILKICKDYFKYGAYKFDEDIFQFDHMHSRILSGKTKKQDLHLDSRICGVSPPTSLHFFLYLNDTSNGNGPTRFVSGSHLIKRFPSKKDNIKAKAVICKRGDMIVLNSSIWHGSDEKQTDEERIIMTLVYTRWFLRQPFAIPYSLKEKKFRFSRQQKKLLGFYNYPAKNENERQGRRGNLPKY